MNNMIAQLESLPDLIRQEIKGLDHKVRNAFTHNDILSTKKIFITGCGDSYFAGVASKLAFKSWCGLSIEVASSLPAGRYEIPYEAKTFPNNPLVIGISVSGGVSRTIEAINIANDIGAKTLAITGNPGSTLAKVSDIVIDCSIPEFVDAPGVRSYQVSLMTLYLIAIHFAEVMGRMTMKEADMLRGSIAATAGTIAKTIEHNKERIKDLAEELRHETNFHIVSHGPNYGTAQFCAAKIVESSGLYAVGQDTEEWAHLEYFNDVKSGVSTLVISPGFRSHELMAEFVSQMKRIGRTIISITPEGDKVVAPLANFDFSVMGSTSEELSPLVYSIAGSIFAAYLADATNTKFFRDGDSRYMVDGDHRRTSQVELKDLFPKI